MTNFETRNLCVINQFCCIYVNAFFVLDIFSTCQVSLISTIVKLQPKSKH